MFKKNTLRRGRDNRISYIRVKMAENGYISLGTAAAALLFAVTGMTVSVKNQGNTPAWAVSICFTSLVFSVAALFWGWRALKEKDKNYIMAKIGIAVGGVLAIFWILLSLVGLRL